MKLNKRGVALMGTGAMVAGLLIGGNTTALWSDSEDIAGGTITAGNLDITAGGAAWQEISDDVNPVHTNVDLGEFRVVPGDHLQMKQVFTVDLEGENMVADLSVSGDAATGDLLADPHGVKLTYSILDANGTSVGTGDIDADGGLTTVDLKPTAGDAPVDYTVQIDAEFDMNTPERVRTQATAALSDLTVNLQQTRVGQTP